MGVHARLAPSSAARWLRCPGSVQLCETIADEPNEYMLEGTAAHRLAQICFEDDNDAEKHVGKSYSIGESDDPEGADAFLITSEMAEYVQVYLNHVREKARGKNKQLLIERRLPLAPITGEPDAFGTADAVVIDNDTLCILDLKFGYQEVEAADNEQLMTYAAAAMLEYSVLGDFQNFEIVIVQPRRDIIDEHKFTRARLLEFIERVRRVAPLALSGRGKRIPGDEQCRFCKARGVCPELAAYVGDLTAGGFEDLDKKPEADLSEAMRMTDLVEAWARAVRAEVERRLVAGMPVRGFKLVAGRMGARKWGDEQAVIDVLKNKGKMSDMEIYKFSLISPAVAEKTLKKRQDLWNEVQALITQSPGLPSVAPSTDPRPAVGSAMDAFEDETGGGLA